MTIIVEGKIIIDGEESHFECDSRESWNQWGATEDRLYKSMPIVEAIQKALLEE
jgi:hypothetical protein